MRFASMTCPATTHLSSLQLVVAARWLRQRGHTSLAAKANGKQLRRPRNEERLARMRSVKAEGLLAPESLAKLLSKGAEYDSKPENPDSLESL